MYSRPGQGKGIFCNLNLNITGFLRRSTVADHTCAQARKSKIIQCLDFVAEFFSRWHIPFITIDTVALYFRTIFKKHIRCCMLDIFPGNCNMFRGCLQGRRIQVENRIVICDGAGTGKRIDQHSILFNGQHQLQV